MNTSNSLTWFTSIDEIHRIPKKPVSPSIETSESFQRKQWVLPKKPVSPSPTSTKRRKFADKMSPDFRIGTEKGVICCYIKDEVTRLPSQEASLPVLNATKFRLCRFSSTFWCRVRNRDTCKFAFRKRRDWNVTLRQWRHRWTLPSAICTAIPVGLVLAQRIGTFRILHNTIIFGTHAVF